jgi:hypothetical protein
MDVTTPSATMGIKGTTVLVEIDTDNGVATAQVTLLRDPDGDVGRVELFDLSQNLIATITRRTPHGSSPPSTGKRARSRRPAARTTRIRS